MEASVHACMHAYSRLLACWLAHAPTKAQQLPLMPTLTLTLVIGLRLPLLLRPRLSLRPRPRPRLRLSDSTNGVVKQLAPFTRTYSPDMVLVLLRQHCGEEESPIDFLYVPFDPNAPGWEERGDAFLAAPLSGHSAWPCLAAPDAHTQANTECKRRVYVHT